MPPGGEHDRDIAIPASADGGKISPARARADAGQDYTGGGTPVVAHILAPRYTHKILS